MSRELSSCASDRSNYLVLRPNCQAQAFGVFPFYYRCSMLMQQFPSPHETIRDRVLQLVQLQSRHDRFGVSLGSSPDVRFNVHPQGGSRTGRPVRATRGVAT